MGEACVMPKADSAKNTYFRRTIEGCRATRPTKGRNDSGTEQEGSDREHVVPLLLECALSRSAGVGPSFRQALWRGGADVAKTLKGQPCSPTSRFASLLRRADELVQCGQPELPLAGSSALGFGWHTYSIRR